MSYFLLCNSKGVVVVVCNGKGVVVCPSLPRFSLHVSVICTHKQENEAVCINALKHSLSVLYTLLTLT